MTDHQEGVGRPANLSAWLPAPIDGQRAFQDLRSLCELGPRPAGSAANTEQRRRVADHFLASGGKVLEQPFRARHPISGAPVPMTNLIGRWGPDRPGRLLIGAHCDTRPHPDLDPDPVRRRGPFLGANDGASGVALLMEIARHLEGLGRRRGVDLILFDGEELVFGQEGEYCLGSQAFARSYLLERRAGKVTWTYEAAIVLDMVGGEGLSIEKEGFSLDFAPEVVEEVWTIARNLGAEVFRDREGIEVIDDHLPLIEAGVPAIVLIDFDFPYWHTAEDRPENCSAESLAQVGRVVSAWLAS
ncbi:M28 family peptidase [soil metagenome]